MEFIYDKEDIGCYADCAMGNDYRRKILSNLMVDFGQDKLAKELTGNSPDDYSDEDAALAILQSKTDKSLIWQMVDGDLMLIESSELE